MNRIASTDCPVRLEFIDVCKVLAMFLVTWAHCAQQISGKPFPDMLLTKDVFISINMPIFMVASGFVINLTKMKESNYIDYFFSRFFRLIVPMTTWYLLLSVVKFPKCIGYWDAYWYLSALFVCLLTIKLFIYFFSSFKMAMISSSIVLSILPFPFFEKSCFMITFIWVGIWLRKIINKIGWRIAIVLLLIYGILYYYWDVEYSIYISPFNIVNVNIQTVFCCFYRFVIGTIGGIAFITIVRLLILTPFGEFLKYLAKYGNYTLVFYTMSFVLNAIISKILWHFEDPYINMAGLLDGLSISITIIMMIIMYYFQKNREL